MHEWSELGELVFDDPLLVLFNAYWEPIQFVLPRLGQAPWRLLVDTARPELPEQAHPEGHYEVTARSLVVLTLPRQSAA
jgi:glycogen operon protein